MLNEAIRDLDRINHVIQNLDKINGLKRKKIQKGLDFIIEENSKEPVIDKLILFGSSIRDDCTENSDIDICIVSNYNSFNDTFFNIYGKLPLIMDELCDIVIYSRLKGKLKEEIDKKGITVYEYTKN